MFAKALERALEPLAGSRFRKADFLAGLGLRVAIDHHAQDKFGIHPDEAGQLLQQPFRRQVRINEVGDAAVQIRVELVLDELTAGFAILRTQHIAFDVLKDRRCNPIYAIEVQFTDRLGSPREDLRCDFVDMSKATTK